MVVRLAGDGANRIRDLRALTVLGALFACVAPDRRPAPAGPAAFGTLTPELSVVGVGDRVTLLPQFYDREGVAITAGAPVLNAASSGVLATAGATRVMALAPGEGEVTATLGTARVAARVRVVPPASRPAIDVFSSVQFQRIHGWEGSAQLGEVDCNPVAFRAFHGEVVDRLVNELGLTRLRLSLRSGVESPVDQWPIYRAGAIDYLAWRRTWMVATNDNADPYVADPAGFQWSFLDYQVDTVVLPIMRKMAANGERLSINLNYVDFFLGAGSKAFLQMKDPEEYAELIRATFDHLKARYGFVPDALELNLEPENTAYDGTDMGRALVAVARRLHAGGYAPMFIGPSTTNAANAPLYYDQMRRVPGAAGLLGELSYHKYTGVSEPSLRAIWLRARRDSISTAMLEHIGSGWDGLYQDLTVANASSWEQFTLAYCGETVQVGNGGVYYQVGQSDPRNPRVNLTSEARLMRQVFHYVRPGAVRLGATSESGDRRPLAFRNTSGAQVVVVEATAPGPFVIRGLAPGTYGVNYGTRRGAYNVDLPDLVATGQDPVEVVMPVAGVVTVYGR